MTYIEKYFLKKLQERDCWTASKLAEEIGLSRQFVHRVLKQMVAKNIILKYGEAPKTYYSAHWGSRINQYLNSATCSDAERIVAGLLDSRTAKSPNEIYSRLLGVTYLSNESESYGVNGANGVDNLEGGKVSQTLGFSAIATALLLLELNHCIEVMPGRGYRLQYK